MKKKPNEWVWENIVTKFMQEQVWKKLMRHFECNVWLLFLPRVTIQQSVCYTNKLFIDLIVGNKNQQDYYSMEKTWKILASVEEFTWRSIA